MIQNKMAELFLHSLEHITHGSLDVTLPDGKQYHFHGTNKGTHGAFHMRDWRLLRTVAQRGNVALTEAYQEGWWETDNLTDLLLFGLQNDAALSRYLYGSMLARSVERFFYFFRRNTLKGSKRNIHAHYDLGNDFYSLWLDPTMTYSSGLFTHQQESLVDAQHNKYDRIIERLRGTSGNLLEMGCGWGGFAERALSKADYAIKGITLSSEQHAYAQKRVGNDAVVALEDYRHQQGKYDHIVSIEMFEAVGEKFWPVYFSKLKTLLQHKGNAVVQTITVNENHFERYRNGSDMIRSFIFPGGMLPSPSRFIHEAQKADLKITDTHAFGLDYAQTLRIWLENFEQRTAQVIKLGFDEKFIRLWRFYLASCIATFTVGRTDVMQLELQHA